MPCTDLEVTSPIMVDAQIQRWTITSDDIYLIQFHEEPPQWLIDIVEGINIDSGLVGDVSDLEDRFNQFEQGYTEHFYDWVDGDTRTLLYVENQYVTNDVFSSGIQEIRTNYVSNAQAGATFDFLMGAWQTGAGGAWFNERVSVVSNVAYSAARSASTLTASLGSTNDQLEFIRGDLDDLVAQVDDVAETWFGETPVLDELTSNLLLDVFPYEGWLAQDTRDIHTGDTYVLIQKDINSNDEYVASYKFNKQEINIPYTDTEGYTWSVITDDLAAQAYQLAIEAGIAADGKINVFHLSYPPTNADCPPNTTLGRGDIWIDEDNNNIMYLYDPTRPPGDEWYIARDTGIQSSVDRLDEATVDVLVLNPVWISDGNPLDEGPNPDWYQDDVNSDPDYLGQPRYIYGTDPDSADNPKYTYEAQAKSSLTLTADNKVTGYYIGANQSSSVFNIFADRFYVSGGPNEEFSQSPFSIVTTDTSTNIRFNGTVSFYSVDGHEDILTTSTTINGGQIDTDSINANRLKVGTIWVDGLVQSNNFIWTSNTIEGFRLDGRETANWNIIGGRIFGGHMEATTLEAVTINTGTLNADVINSGSITELKKDTSGGDRSIQVYNKKGTGTQLTYSLNASQDYGNIYLVRGGSILAIIGSTESSGVYTHNLTYIDDALDATYYIKGWNGTVGYFDIGVGIFSAVLFKK